MIEPRLYRAAFLPALLAVIVTMFSLENRPPGLPQALAADVLFQGKVADDTVNQFVAQWPDRRAGTVGDRAAARSVARTFAQSGFTTVMDPFQSGGKELVNVIARRAGGSRRQLVILADRDATSMPDATGSAADTGALVEIARVLQGTPSRKTIVLASVDGGSLGEVGARRMLASLPDRDKIEAVIVLSNLAAPGPAVPPLVTWSNGPERVGVGLERTAASSMAQEFGKSPGGSGAAAQMIRLAFPLGVGAQGPLLDDGVDAVRFSASGELPPPVSKRGPASVDVNRLGSLGRSVLRTVFAIDQGTRQLERGPTSYVSVGQKVLPRWALALLGLSLIAPALIASVDGFARASRRREPVGRFARWVLVAALPLLAAVVLAKLIVWTGVISEPPSAPLSPTLRPLHIRGIVVLGVLAVVAAALWIAAWRSALRAGRRGRLDLASPGAGAVLALVLSLTTLAVWFVNPFTALMLVPALHLWMLASIAQLPRRGPVPILLAAGGLLPLVISALYYLDRLSVGPLRGLWYLFLLVAGGDVGIFASLFSCVLVGVFGCLVAMLVARARKAPPARIEEAEQPSIFGPGGYAGPGALGGTESAIRR